MNNVLKNIISEKIQEVESLKKTHPVPKDRPYKKRPFAKTLTSGDFGIIAEIKKASPSAGLICKNFNPISVVKRYEETEGVKCISVLTDKHFKGSVKHLADVRNSCGIPILRKDFIIDEYQVRESSYFGADCILLIARLFVDDVLKLRKLSLVAKEEGLDVLVEVHKEEELEMLDGVQYDLVGINNRDLDTLEIDLNTTLKIAPKIQAGESVVCESGVKSSEDLEMFKRNGIKYFLIGESLMKNSFANKC